MLEVERITEGGGEGRKPHVLFIVCDCMTNDVLTVPRYRKRVRFPRWFSDRSLVCTRMITSSTTTTPSFGSMLSGLFPAQHGIRLLYGHRLRRGVKTLPMLLKEQGYQTVAEVSGPLFTSAGLEKGFDVFDYRSREHLVSGDLMLEKRDRIVKLLSDDDRPAFVMLHIWDLHDPRYKYIKNGMLNKAFNEQFKYLTYYDDYLDTMRYVDDYLMGLLEALPEEAVVALTGDHGEMYQTNVFESVATYMVKVATGNKKFMTSHGQDVNLQLLEVPFWMRWPEGPTPPVTVDRVVRNADIFPTLLEAAGVTAVPMMQAESLLPLVEGSGDSNRIAFSESGGGGMGRKDMVAFSVMDNHFQVRYYPHTKRGYEFWSVPKDKRVKAEGEAFQLYKELLDDYLMSAVRADVRGIGRVDPEDAPTAD